MAIEYKPTKPKKEKPAKAPKAPKAPKAEKPVKIGAVQKVKTTKPKKVKEPKVKAQKPEKTQAFTPAFKGGKVQKAEKLEKNSGLKKISPAIIITAVSILAVLIIAAVVVFTVVLPAIERKGEAISGIEITRLPDKTTYLVGEEADYTGLRVTVTRNNGEKFVVRATDCEISGFNSDIPMENRVVTLKYAGFTELFSVKINENEKPTPVLKGIRLEPMPKTEYKVGEWLDTSGAYIVREYTDGSEVRVNMLKTDVWGWDKVWNKGPGTYTLTVKYAENGVLCTYEYEITVSPATE